MYESRLVKTERERLIPTRDIPTCSLLLEKHIENQYNSIGAYIYSRKALYIVLSSMNSPISLPYHFRIYMCMCDLMKKEEGVTTTLIKDGYLWRTHTPNMRSSMYIYIYYVHI